MKSLKNGVMGKLPASSPPVREITDNQTFQALSQITSELTVAFQCKGNG